MTKGALSEFFLKWFFYYSKTWNVNKDLFENVTLFCHLRMYVKLFAIWATSDNVYHLPSVKAKWEMNIAGGYRNSKKNPHLLQMAKKNTHVTCLNWCFLPFQILHNRKSHYILARLLMVITFSNLMRSDDMHFLYTEQNEKTNNALLIQSGFNLSQGAESK